MKKWFINFTILLFYFTSYGVNYITIESGDWNSALVWAGALVPPTTLTDGDNITITLGNSINLEGNLTFGTNSTLTVNGSLTIDGSLYAADNFTTLINGRLAVDGVFTVGDNHTSTVNGNFLINNNYTVQTNALLTIRGTQTIYGDLNGSGSNILNGNGQLFIQGIISGFITTGFSGNIEDGFLTSVGFTNNGAYIKLTNGSCMYVDGNTNGLVNTKFSEGADGLFQSDGTLILEGNWNNFSSDSVFKNRNTTGIILFKGINSQLVTGTQITEFENIKLNNLSGLQIRKNTQINHQLNFLNGSITTGTTDTLIVKNNTANAIINQDATRNITGNLRRYLSAGNYQFPLSDGGDYLPALLNIQNMGSMSYVSAKFTSTALETVPLGLNVSGTPIYDFLDRGYWTFTPDNGTGVIYDLTLTSEGHTNGGVEATQHAIFKRDGGDWENVGDHDNLTQSGSGTNPVTATRSNLTGFSDFIIGVSESWPLPVSLVNFYGICSSNEIQLYWETLTETENDKFVLEYSFDGLQYHPLTEIPGAGNSNQPVHYHFSHSITSSALVYYKLTQYDFNGNSHEYAAIPVYCNNEFIENLYVKSINPQGVEISFNSLINDKITAEMIDPLGRVLMKDNAPIIHGENILKLNLNPGLSGACILRIYTTYHLISKKIILP